MLATADAGGSNATRSRLWKVELQRFADETGLKVSVCHFPPGTSKWNKIEHRMFSRIAQNWRGRPLVSREAVVESIVNTTTRQGLTIRAELARTSVPRESKSPMSGWPLICKKDRRWIVGFLEAKSGCSQWTSPARLRLSHL